MIAITNINFMLKKEIKNIANNVPNAEPDKLWK